MDFFKRLIGLSGHKEKELKELKDKALVEKKKTAKELRELNRGLRLVLEHGTVEVTIKNVKGVIEEIKELKK